MSVESSIFPVVLLDLSSFLDEILMPRDSPPIMQTGIFCFMLEFFLPRMQMAIYANDRLCKWLFMQVAIFFRGPVFLCTNLHKVLWSKLCLDPCTPGNALHDVWGTL